MSSIFGNKLKISIFGESHGEAIGVVLDGLPCGEKIDIDKVIEQIERRCPGNDETATNRKESDVPKILSGFLNGFTTGAPLSAIIENNNKQSICCSYNGWRTRYKTWTQWTKRNI